MELDPYALARDADTGQFLFVLRRADKRRLTPQDGPEYEAFVAWNANRNPPLDTSPNVFPPDHHFFPDLASLVDYCKRLGVTLCVDWQNRPFGRFNRGLAVTFPEKGRLYQLDRAVASPMAPIPVG